MHKCLTVLAIVAGASLLFWFVWTTGAALLLLFSTLLVAVALDGLARALARVSRLSRRLAVVAVIVSFASLIGLTTTFSTISISSKAPELGNKIEQAVAAWARPGNGAGRDWRHRRVWLLDVPFPILLGTLAGLLTFIPYLGAIISAIPALLIAGLGGLWPMLYVVLLYLGLHAVAAYLLTPLIQRRTASFAPAFCYRCKSCVARLPA